MFSFVKTVGDNLQSLRDLRIFDSQRHQNTQHVVVRPAGEQDQAFIPRAGDDIRRQFGVGFAVIALSKSSMAIIAPGRGRRRFRDVFRRY